MDTHTVKRPRNWGIRLGGALLSAGFICAANADGFEMFSSPEQLEGKAILKAGNISRMASFSAEPIGLLGRGEITYQLGLYCFRVGRGDDLTNKAGLLLVDQAGTPSLAVVSDSISSIKVAVQPVALYDCQALIRQKIQQQTDDLNRQMEAIKQQHELNEQLIKRLKKAQSGNKP